MSNQKQVRAGVRVGASAYEKRGGYSPTGSPVSKLPRVPPGPAPGAMPKAAPSSKSGS